MVVKLKLTYAQLQEMVTYAKTSPEKEVCGVLIGLKENSEYYRLTTFLPIKNDAEGKTSDYIFNKKEFFEALQTTNRINLNSALDIVGIFHSHPFWRAYPSNTDINEAGYEGVYIIYSNIYDDILAWYNEGSENTNINYAMFEGQKGFGKTHIILT